MFKLFLLLNPIYVTLFWAIVLLLAKPYHNRPKIFLGLFMFVAFLIYLSHLFYYLPIPEAYHYLDSVYQVCSLLTLPMYYIYIRLLTVDEKLEFRKHFVYLIAPLVLFVFYLAGTFFMTKAEHIHFVFEIIPNKEPVTGIYLYQKIFLMACRVLYPLQGFLYMFMSLHLLIKYRKNVLNFYSNTEEDSVDKIFLLSLTLCLSILTGITISLISKEQFLENSEYKLIAPSIIFSVMYFLIGWLGIKQRPVLTEDVNKDDEFVSNEDADTLIQLEGIRLKLEKSFSINKIYLNKDLTIWDLAKEIGTNRTYISFIINNHYKKNFSSFVNAYRVQYAKSLLEKNSKISNSDLAEVSGFGSVLSMQRAFQSLEGVSLKEYRNMN